jgi:hypothetical protein|tara:strand:+ start:124 stop:453 length:330 start_codon:yes stop_codon:yes gene_type:complete
MVKLKEMIKDLELGKVYTDKDLPPFKVEESEQINESTYVKGKMMVILKNSFKQVHDSFVNNVIKAPDLTDDEKYQAFNKFRKMMDTARSNYVNAVMKASKPFDKKLTGV